MSRPISTTSFSRQAAYKRYVLAALAGIALFYGLTPALFFIFPRHFYESSWSYFEDLVYKSKDFKPEWDGYEFGDLSRDNLFFYREKYFTRVTTDEEGFRTIPLQATNYPIALIGDSMAFGHGFSDKDTLSWKLAEELKVPVFNGARIPLLNDLANPHVVSAKIIIECLEENNLDRNFFDLQARNPDDVLRPGNLSRWEALEAVPAERYFLPSILVRWFERFQNDLKDLKEAGWDFDRLPRYKFYWHPMEPVDLETAVRKIAERKAYISQKGYLYLFVPVPLKQDIYAEEKITPFDRQYLGLLVKKLNERGVAALDLTGLFRENRNLPHLYWHYDTHWNYDGIDLAAHKIADFLKEDPQFRILWAGKKR